MIEGVIFDMGGVLLRTVNPLPRKEMAERFGTNRKELENAVFLSESSLRSEVGKMSAEDHWKTVLHQFGQKNLNPTRAYDEFFSGDALDDELLDFIKGLRKRYKFGLLSNAWVDARHVVEKAYSFLDAFDVSVFSYELGIRKPDRKIFEYILDKLRLVPEQAVFVDDFIENVEGARSLGMVGIQFINTIDTVKELSRLLDLE